MNGVHLPWDLTSEDGERLLDLARGSLSWMVSGGDLIPLRLESLPETLRAPGAAFVTLHLGGALRGCVGSGEAYRPLAVDVADNATKVAYRDPRFPPLAPDELRRVQVEVSVLSSLRPLTYREPEELLAKLRPGVDGVVILHGIHRALFLPQVWDMLPDAAEFLAHLCRKAGLPARAFVQEPLNVLTFETRTFRESPSSQPQEG